ncbi:MAG: PAS domain-containing sensor histidine kinase [Bacteroidaceae bacterium]|nr:PAS domain-containing sensor histidine kinase [Bacteroidaceae bacterium]MBR1939784.1 PAS domain-containing sensor histidine kinase [Bacteroidaceae bacterium]
MKLKHIFWGLAVLLCTVWVLLMTLVMKEHTGLFFITEGLITLSILYLIYFYHKVVKPMNAIINGMDLLREQDFSSRLKLVHQKEADQIVGVFNQMMLQLKNEHLRVREQNHFMDLLISASPMGVVILDYDGFIQLSNKAGLQFMGYEQIEQIKGLALSDLTTPLGREIAAIKRGESQTVRLSDSMIYRCSHLTFTDHGFPHPFILIESLTDEVMKAEKKAYEKVIRLIAHEVNNSVAGITSGMDTVNEALQDMPDTVDLQDLLRVCMERLYGMSGFITSFADVVKIPAPQLEETDVNTVVSQSKAFMESLCLEHDIQLHLDLSAEPLLVKLDISLFEQVLVNIIKNATESIGQHGDIWLSTTQQPPMLVVADNGAGISKEAEQKLFTPFFSTKPKGQGIGLMLIREVLTSHHFKFSLHTADDGITRFTIVMK